MRNLGGYKPIRGGDQLARRDLALAMSDKGKPPGKEYRNEELFVREPSPVGVDDMPSGKLYTHLGRL